MFPQPMFTLIHPSPLMATAQLMPQILLAPSQPQVLMLPVLLSSEVQTPPPAPPTPRIIQPRPLSPPLDDLGTYQLEDLEPVDDAELDDIRNLVQSFKEKRVALGLTQAQVAEDFQSQFGIKTANQSVICRIERLDFNLRHGRQMKPWIINWLATADERYCYLSTSGALEPLNFNRYVLGKTVASQSKKRQKRTKISPENVDALNSWFQADALPNQYRLNEIAADLRMDYKTVKIWFRNKRQMAKRGERSSQ